VTPKKERDNGSFKKKIIVVGVGFLFFVLLIASFFGKKGLIEIYQTQKKKEALLQEIEMLERKKAALERDIEELQSNPKAVEKKARDKLGLVKPDEIVIIDNKNH
jgi:cell division protein FtsB